MSVSANTAPDLLSGNSLVTMLPSKVFSPCSRSLSLAKAPRDPEWVVPGWAMTAGNWLMKPQM
jgi:hypothetical protein